MLGSLNLDQLRVFIAIVDSGSFSAAARDLKRAQSAISSAVVNLENSIGVVLFDRSGWRPHLTAHGSALLVDAREIISRSDRFRSRAAGLSQGLESELSVVVDVMFPMNELVELVASFQKKFPSVVLRLCTDVLGGVAEKVLSGEYDLGVQGSLPDIDPGLFSYNLPEISLVPVAAAGFPLIKSKGLKKSTLELHTQIVLTDHSQRTKGRSFSVFANRQILTADLGSKQAMLRAGLGWGFMPHSHVKEDIESGRLVKLDIADLQSRNRSIPLFLIRKISKVPGVASQWVIEKMSSSEGYST